jgi:hypothetical protein
MNRIKGKPTYLDQMDWEGKEKDMDWKGKDRLINWERKAKP